VNAPPLNTFSAETALLVLDASGIVRSANDAAGRLWQTPPASLAGQLAVSLFAFEVVSNDPGWRESQWEVLIATALGRPLRLQAQPFEPESPVEVFIELQSAHGPDAAFFARITPRVESAAGTPAVVPTTPSAPSPAPSVPSPDNAPSLLAARGSLGFFDIDFTNGRTVTSPAWKRMLGYMPGELADTYDAWRELIHPDDTAALPDHVGKPPAGNCRDFSVEFRLRHHAGHYVWVQSSGIQLFNADHTLARVIGVNLDITERKESEEIGFASEDRLGRLGDEGALALFDFDFITGQNWFSSSWKNLLGAGEEPSIEAFLDALPPTDAELGAAGFLTQTATGEPFFMRPLVLRSGDGEKAVVLGAHRQWSRKRELLRAVGFVLSLPAGTGGGPIPPALMSGLLDTLGEAVIVTDARAQILHLNEKASRLTGYALDATRQLKLGDVFKLVRRNDGVADDTAIDLVLAAEEEPRLYAEHALVSTEEGKAPTPVIWTTRQIWAPEGGSAGIIVVFRDPQEMTLTPEEIIRANRFDSLGQLAGGIAHDFNNLLTTILGGISTAKDNRDYTKLEDAESACMAAKALTRQLLTFAKGGASAAQQVVATRAILQDAVRIAAAGTTAVVTVDVPDEVDPIQVDRGQIIQVFQNLVINALQAMPDVSKGRVTLRALNITLGENDVPPLPAGDYVQIEVHDNGSGIPPESIEKIFEPFYTTKKQGTGLGLATVLSIVRTHGGQIGVDSTVGSGTTFTLFFPKAEQAVEAAVRMPAALRFGTGRILFLDDDPKICELTAGMLTSLEYTHDVVRTGEDAIACYRRYLNVGRPYDAVILDLNVVGGMGGEECFKHLRDLHPEVRAIVNSGYDSEDMARRYLDMGFVGYLTKPYRVGDLGRALKAALGK
jgi:two-component system, cell cycle sensor histidine kinase and response regulator CckA